MDTTDRRATIATVLAAALLLWPALWNAYPIVFADSGTYLSQTVHRYLGWDRPVFYSLFLLPLHLTVTIWPVIVAQALLVAWVLQRVMHALRCDVRWLPVVTALLSVATGLPWLVCQIMPDILTPLLVLILCLLVVTGSDLPRGEAIVLVAAAGFMIAAQQSSVPLSLAVLVMLIPLRHRLGAPGPLHWPLAIGPVALALTALVAMNLAAYGRFSLSPYGNVFVLARVIYDGPGRSVLQHRCPDAGWRLCGFIDRLPPTSDDFLWQPDSPIVLAGGHKAVSSEADAIIGAALRDYPMAELRAVLANAWEQLQRFATGDGLQPWPTEVTPWIERDFPPREVAAYSAARQQQARLAVPAWLVTVHRAVELAGVVASACLLPLAIRRQHPAAAFLAAVLFTLPASALITGGLSTPHDRYQSRVMWLAPCVATLAYAALQRRPT